MQSVVIDMPYNFIRRASAAAGIANFSTHEKASDRALIVTSLFGPSFSLFLCILIGLQSVLSEAASDIDRGIDFYPAIKEGNLCL